MVRVRIQMNHPDYVYSSLFSGLKQIHAKQGFWRLYKSAKLYFACKTLFTAVQFQVFEMICYLSGPNNHLLFLNTIIATSFATMLLNPLQVLLTRYALVDTTKKKLVFSSMVQRIFKKQGISGFYKGFGTQVIINCLLAMFMLPVYKISREYFKVEIME